MSYEATMNALPPRAVDWTMADMRRFIEEVHNPEMKRFTNEIRNSLVCQTRMCRDAMKYLLLAHYFNTSIAFFKLDTLDREVQKINGVTSLYKLNIMPGLGATMIDISDIVSSPIRSTTLTSVDSSSNVHCIFTVSAMTPT
jgi:hypothetical protein